MSGTSNDTPRTGANTSTGLPARDPIEVSPESPSPAQEVDPHENLELATAPPPLSADANGGAVPLGAQLWKRRNMLTALLSLAAGAGLVLYGRWSDIFPKPPVKRTGHPYFRKKKRPVLARATTVV